MAATASTIPKATKGTAQIAAAQSQSSVNSRSPQIQNATWIMEPDGAINPAPSFAGGKAAQMFEVAPAGPYVERTSPAPLACGDDVPEIAVQFRFARPSASFVGAGGAAHLRDRRYSRTARPARPAAGPDRRGRCGAR